MLNSLTFFDLPGTFVNKNLLRAEWPSGLYSLRQVTEVKLGRVRSDSGWGRVRSDSGWVTSEA